MSNEKCESFEKLVEALGPPGYMLYVKKQHEEETLKYLDEHGFAKYEPRSGTVKFADLHRTITECDWCREPFDESDEIVMIWRISKENKK